MTTNEDLKDLIIYFDDGEGISGQTALYIGSRIQQHFGQRGLVLLNSYLKCIGDKVTLDGRNKELWEKLEALNSI